MKIEIWTDFSCPLCYVGKRKLEIAVEQFPHKDRITIDWISFPNVTAEEQCMTIEELLKERHGFENVNLVLEQLIIEAEAIGLPLRFDKTPTVNTYDAHRLLQLAKKQEKEQAFVDDIFESYFANGYLIDNKQVLRNVALQVGLDEQLVDETLSMNCFAKSVEADIALTEELGIGVTPFIVLEEKYALPGIQTEKELLQVLHDIWEEEGYTYRPLQMKDKKEKKYCTGNDCEV